MIFRLDCGFLVADSVPSESAYSRMITMISESNVLERVQDTILLQAITEEFIDDDTVATDACHFEARDQASPKEEKPQIEPKKRGRKSKAEREQWLLEQAEREANLPLFEKKIVDQLYSFSLRTDIPQEPRWGIKENSEGKNVFWYGFKAHLAVGAKSQYILQSLFSSGNLNDGKATIPLLKGIHERLSLASLRYHTMDAGYDYEPHLYTDSSHGTSSCYCL
jgi:transposase